MRGFYPAMRAAVVALALLRVAAGVHANEVETELLIESPVLGRPITAAMYRPTPSPPSGERWPVLYLLHGLAGLQTDWLRSGSITATLDREIAAGRMRPLLVVMPMAGSSWYVDDPAGAGFIARAFTSDLITGVDARLPTAACREARAVAGLSMGGYGALLYAFDHPDLFSSAISLSGSIFAPMPDDPGARAARPTHMFGTVLGDPFDWRRFNA